MTTKTDEEIIRELWFGFKVNTSGETKQTKEVRNGMEQARTRKRR
jgi:hypothetical protein